MAGRLYVPAHVTATTVVSKSPCTLSGVLVGTAAVGQTLELHDCAATGDVAAGNLKSIIQLDTRDSYPFGTEGAYFAVGLVAVVSGGAPDLTVVYG